ncbi:MAG: hypothetical protein E6R06_26100 [Mycobacterium sp.]|nr:MAG: hypothetical protein E6R06_26100 [Mycobacterium sp.]
MRRHRAVDRKVVVNLRSGNAIEGVCTYDGRDHMIVRGALVHEAGAEGAVPADGEVRIDRANVDYTQLL